MCFYLVVYLFLYKKGVQIMLMIVIMTAKVLKNINPLPVFTALCLYSYTLLILPKCCINRNWLKEKQILEKKLVYIKKIRYMLTKIENIVFVVNNVHKNRERTVKINMEVIQDFLYEIWDLPESLWQQNWCSANAWRIRTICRQVTATSLIQRLPPWDIPGQTVV